ncbi:hypothetical protein BJ742DRAFT_743902 [Cladochytrium replicatum]|nr:hypothetical protein BJ742DRAFT_743902 [Cladochytrium replicatum]
MTVQRSNSRRIILFLLLTFLLSISIQNVAAQRDFPPAIFRDDASAEQYNGGPKILPTPTTKNTPTSKKRPPMVAPPAVARPVHYVPRIYRAQNRYVPKKYAANKNNVSAATAARSNGDKLYNHLRQKG